MSEHTDATDDRSEDDEVDPDAGEPRDDGAEEQPQPWAKTSSGDDD
jgi:hypothetical protein